jgi:hypothetical protein
VRIDQLLAQIRRECREIASVSATIDRGVRAVSLYELACACEQVLSDCHADAPSADRQRLHAMSLAWAGLASQLATQLFYSQTTSHLLEVVDRVEDRASEQQVTWATELAQLSAADPSALYATSPECFSRDLVDLWGYARFVERQVKVLIPTTAIVVGIRTTGSVLVPIWSAALTSIGAVAVALTARPHRRATIGAGGGGYVDPSPTDVFEPTPEDDLRIHASLAGVDLRTTVAIVIDDVAHTGSSFLRVENYIAALGMDRRRVLYTQNSPLILRSLTPEARASLGDRVVLVPPRIADGPTDLGEDARAFFEGVLCGQSTSRFRRVTAVELAPPTFAHRYIATQTTVPIRQVVRFDPRGGDRHYLVRAERSEGGSAQLFAKLLGVGNWAEWELARIAHFEDLGYRGAFHSRGFLFYDWIEGELLDCDDGPTLAISDIHRLAEHAVLLAAHSGAGRMSKEAYCDEVVQRARSVVTTGQGRQQLRRIASEFLAGSPADVSLVEVSRNQAHWHYVRTRYGAIHRVHLELGEWSWKLNIAEELAAAAIELSLSVNQRVALISKFVDRTGDDNVTERMPLATISYLTRALSSYAHWDALIEQFPAAFRPHHGRAEASAEVRRRVQLIAALERATMS